MNYELRRTRCWRLAGLMLICLFVTACNQSPPPAAIEKSKPRPAENPPATVRAPVILRPQPTPSPFELPPEIPLDHADNGADKPWQPPRLSPDLLPPAPPRER